MIIIRAPEKIPAIIGTLSVSLSFSFTSFSMAAVAFDVVVGSGVVLGESQSGHLKKDLNVICNNNILLTYILSLAYWEEFTDAAG